MSDAPTVRPALASLVVRQPYLSCVYAKIPGEANWTQLDQGKVVTPSSTAETKEYRRIGDQNVTTVGGTVKHDITVQMYVENNWDEVARLLGFARSSSWVGTENIQLDPTRVIDLKIENYNSLTTGAASVMTEYINRFSPLTLSPALDADGDARIADLSGSAVAYYIIPSAGS
jgi:hypothetical protein